MDNAVEPIGRMTPYGAEHLGVLVLTVVLAVAVVIVGRRIRGTVLEDRYLTAAGWVMLAVTILWMAWGMLPSHWNIEQSLPLHYSDALRLITAIALLTRAGWAIAVCYFWGLTLNLQSIITPDLNYFDYPVLEFVIYWFLHIVAFVVPILFIWGLGYRPTWRSYGITFLVTVLWAVIAIITNAVTGANYGYLSRAPEGPSILDALGPWPTYMLWEALMIAIVWALMTWPWQTKAAGHIPVADQWATVRRQILSEDAGNRDDHERESYSPER